MARTSESVVHVYSKNLDGKKSELPPNGVKKAPSSCTLFEKEKSLADSSSLMKYVPSLARL